MVYPKRTSSILIADENLLFRRGLRALLAGEQSFHVAGEVSNTGDLLAQIRELRPNVLVIDAGLLTGWEPARLGLALRQAQPELLILVLAQQDTEEMMTAAIACGAKGFALKSAGPAQLIASLSKVAFHEGGMNDSGMLPDFQALAIRTSRDDISGLTPREQEVMNLLAEGKTVRRVANDLLLSMKTVEAHKLNLMRKLDIHDRAALIQYANRDRSAVAAH